MYNTPWFLMKPRFRRYLCLIMVQAEKTPVLTAGRLIKVDVVAFSMVNISNVMMKFEKDCF